LISRFVARDVVRQIVSKLKWTLRFKSRHCSAARASVIT